MTSTVAREGLADLREKIAFELWQRFAPVHHIGWKNETHKAEYLLAADDVLSALRTSPQPDSGVAEREQIKEAVSKILKKGVWPEYRTEDDRGLEVDEYVDFILEVQAALARPNPVGAE